MYPVFRLPVSTPLSAATAREDKVFKCKLKPQLEFTFENFISYKCNGKALLKLLKSKNGLLVFAYQPTGRKAGVQHKFSDLATFLQTTSEF